MLVRYATDGVRMGSCAYWMLKRSLSMLACGSEVRVIRRLSWRTLPLMSVRSISDWDALDVGKSVNNV
jgi:hypothetical protein